MGETTRTPARGAGTPRADDVRGRLARRAGLVVALLAALAALAAVTTGSALTARWLAGRSGALTPIPTATTIYHVPPPVELPLFRDGQRCGVDPQTVRVGCTYADLLCPQAVAWSPDARQVAILSRCGGFHGYGNTILVYDTAAGHLRATIALDAIIAHARDIPDNCQGEPRSKSLAAQALFWLPSGRLAVLGSFYLWTALIEGTSCPPWDALVLVDADGAHPQVALAPTRTQAAGDGSSIPCGRTWDLQAASPAAASAAGGDCPLPAALGYRWADGGNLQPLTPLTSATAPPAPGPGPVGTPAGGAQFTVWQSAVVIRSHPSGTSDTATATGADLYELVESLGALSPDGRYAYAGAFPLLYRLEPAGQQPPSPSELQQAGAADEPLLPVKDAALQRVLAELPPPAPAPDGSGFDSQFTTLTWRADGAVVAALGPDLGGAGQAADAQQAVRVLACASGSVRLSLTPLADPAHKQAFGPASLILSWAPDGSRLLLISGARGTATLWDLQGLR